MTVAILICHGKLAFELINTVTKILGHAEDAYPFSNEGLSPEALYRKITTFLKTLPENTQPVFLVDMLGGNCWTVARMICQEFSQGRVVSGVNLPMLISFLTKRQNFSFDELVKILKQDGHRGIQIS